MMRLMHLHHLLPVGSNPKLLPANPADGGIRHQGMSPPIFIIDNVAVGPWKKPPEISERPSAFDLP